MSRSAIDEVIGRSVRWAELAPIPNLSNSALQAPGRRVKRVNIGRFAYAINGRFRRRH